jgi:hypothetical protein
LTIRTHVGTILGSQLALGTLARVGKWSSKIGQKLAKVAKRVSEQGFDFELALSRKDGYQTCR